MAGRAARQGTRKTPGIGESSSKSPTTFAMEKLKLYLEPVSAGASKFT